MLAWNRSPVPAMVLINSETMKGVDYSVIEHGMTSLSFQTAVQKNEAKLSSFVQFENEMASYRAL